MMIRFRRRFTSLFAALLIPGVLLFCGGCTGFADTSASPPPSPPAIPDDPAAPPPEILPPEVEKTAPDTPQLPPVPATVQPPEPGPIPIPAPEAVNLLLPPDPETGKFTRSDSYLTNWSLLAIPTRPGGNPQTLLQAELLPAERALYPTPGDDRWKIVQMTAPGSEGPTLAELIPVPDAVAYLAVRLDSSRAWSNLKILLGGGGLQKLWLNGELLYADTRGPRPPDADPEEIPDINLRKGENFLLVKTVRFAPEWELRLRLTASDGAPFRFAPLAEKK